MPPPPVELPPSPKLTRAVVEASVAAGRPLLIQGAMGLHASDGLAGRVASAPSTRFLPVGTISAPLKTEAGLVAEIRRARSEAPSGYVGVNLMAAINTDDFEALAHAALAEGVSFIVQGAGISRDIIRWCREANTPFVGIVSSGRLAAMYERWGADLVVAEGSDAGGHIGDITHALPSLVDEVKKHTSLPVIAAGGIVGEDIARYLQQGAAGVQLATRFLACTDGDAHPRFKEMHLGKTKDDVVVITSCVKGMQARAVRSPFTEALARGEIFPPKAKSWFTGREGYRTRRKSCVECLGSAVCLSKLSNHTESFCITDSLLYAAIDGDLERGLFYSGSSVTRLPEKSLAECADAHGLVARIEAELQRAEATVPVA